MQCPYCDHPDSKVIDSRSVDGGIRRRRECLRCSARFTTYERIATTALYVIKKDGRREEFHREKLLAGIRKACEKRPLPTGTVERVAENIETELHRLGRPEVPSSLVGELVMERLREVDHIAYIRFASVYRSFADLQDLQRELEALTQRREGRTPPPGQLPLFGGPEPARPRRGRRTRPLLG